MFRHEELQEEKMGGITSHGSIYHSKINLYVLRVHSLNSVQGTI